MKKTGFLLTLLFSVAIVTTTYAQEQKKDEITSGKAVKGQTSRGQDPNIRSEERRKNVADGDMETQAIQPLEKGAQPRGAYSWCTAVVDNHTKWYLDVYIDGYYEGYVSPWGSGSVNVTGGNTKQYVVAEFRDGSRVWWGPSTKYCYNETLEMDIYSDYYYQSIK